MGSPPVCKIKSKNLSENKIECFFLFFEASSEHKKTMKANKKQRSYSNTFIHDIYGKLFELMKKAEIVDQMANNFLQETEDIKQNLISNCFWGPAHAPIPFRPRSLSTKMTELFAFRSSVIFSTSHNHFRNTLDQCHQSNSKISVSSDWKFIHPFASFHWPNRQQ